MARMKEDFSIFFLPLMALRPVKIICERKLKLQAIFYPKSFYDLLLGWVL